MTYNTYYFFYNIYVPLFWIAAYIIDLSVFPFMEDCINCRAVIIYKYPVADIQAVAINRKRFAF